MRCEEFVPQNIPVLTLEDGHEYIKLSLPWWSFSILFLKRRLVSTKYELISVFNSIFWDVKTFSLQRSCRIFQFLPLRLALNILNLHSYSEVSAFLFLQRRLVGTNMASYSILHSQSPSRRSSTFYMSHTANWVFVCWIRVYQNFGFIFSQQETFV